MIRRAPKPQSNFYLLDKSISEDGRLSWGARGLLVYLLGKPDHWEVSVAHLIKQTAGAGKKTGRDGVYSLLKELEDAGYLRKQQGRAEGGSFATVDYLVSEAPLPAKPDTAAPETAQPDTGQPLPANPTQVSIDTKQGLNTASNTAVAVTGGDDPPKQPPKFEPMALCPPNVSPDVWAQWIQHRKEIKRKLTPTTCDQQRKKLAGIPYADAVILNSISNGWTGLFPEKAKPGGSNPTYKTAQDKRAERNAAIFDYDKARTF